MSFLKALESITPFQKAYTFIKKNVFKKGGIKSSTENILPAPPPPFQFASDAKTRIPSFPATLRTYVRNKCLCLYYVFR